MVAIQCLILGNNSNFLLMLKPFILSILLLGLAAACCDDEEPKEIITETGTSNDQVHSGICFSNEEVGYISSGGNLGLNVAVIFKTVDGGVSWQMHLVYVDTIPTSVIRSIYALSPDTVYATYAGGVSQGVCKSVDGGFTWMNLGNLNTSAYGPVYFRNSQIGIVCSSYGILKTTDGGSTWVLRSNLTAGGDIAFTSDAVGYACIGSAGDWGSSGRVIKTTDGGDTWTVLSSLTEYVTCLKFVDDSTGYAFTYNDRLYKTTNGGQSWKLQAALPGGWYYSAVVTGSTKYFAALKKIYRSTDDFKSCTEIYSSSISNNLIVSATRSSKNTTIFLCKYSIIKVTQQ